LISHKTIFISPLDWGLGHATRCVSIIRKLEKKNKIIIGVTPRTKKHFEREFPQHEKVEVPAYNIKYSTVLPIWLKLVSDWPRISEVIKKEHAITNLIISKYNVDVVISDNRFGMFSKYAHTIFITHQVFLKAPFANTIAQKQNSNYIKNFDELWIPDFENESESLAGALSHGDHFHKNVKYIGPQSALSNLEPIPIENKKVDVLILLSGVEPQRTVLEKDLIAKFKNSTKRIVLVRGGDSEMMHFTGSIEVVNFAFGVELKHLILKAETIICRSGYSTLMDLQLLGKDPKKIILIPTPGQTEQEYLAEYWKLKFGALNCSQNKINSLEG
jgi:uncharacterized protein (TIGR00661 family)